MSKRKILTFPEPVLRKKAKTITTFDDDLRELAADMAETMYDAPGVGLAAPQVG
jgi:peptide deformylase